jgi:hypothetical protein
MGQPVAPIFEHSVAGVDSSLELQQRCMANRTKQIARDRGPQQSHVQQRCMPNGKQDTTSHQG